LEKAYEERHYRLLFLDIDVRLDGLRSDPRFANLKRRIKELPRMHHHFQYLSMCPIIHPDPTSLQGKLFVMDILSWTQP